MRPVIRRILLALAGIAGGLVLAEFLLHVLPFGPGGWDLHGLHEVHLDRPWIYGLRPGAHGVLSATGGVRYAINADGLRGPAYARPKPPGNFRIVVVGDSVSYGFGVEEGETYPVLLEEILAREAAPRRLEVVNLGVGGYNPYLEAALFTDVGVTYEPDVVLVQFTVNDLNDPTIHFNASASALLRIPDAAFPDPTHRRPPPPPPTALDRACGALRSCSRIRRLLTKPDIPDAAMLEAAFAPHDDPPLRELVWLRHQYETIARAADGVGARFAVVVFPSQPQLDPRAPDTLQQRLITLGRDAGWTVIDLLPAFRRATAAPRAPFFLDRWHPSGAGHRIAAAATARALACRGLVPVPAPDGCDQPAPGAPGP